MSTQAQIDANRANAAKSSGPVTDSGKAASSQNRSSHRLSIETPFRVLPGENQSEFYELVLKLSSEFNAETSAEWRITDRMAEHEWMRRRAISLQERTLMNEKFIASRLSIFMRYESQHERAYNACVNQLLKLRAATRSETIGFEREKRSIEQNERTKQRHELTQKGRLVDIDCKIIRTLRTSANNPEALDAAREVKTRYQAA